MSARLMRSPYWPIKLVGLQRRQRVAIDRERDQVELRLVAQVVGQDLRLARVVAGHPALHVLHRGQVRLHIVAEGDDQVEALAAGDLHHQIELAEVVAQDVVAQRRLDEQAHGVQAQPLDPDQVLLDQAGVEAGVLPHVARRGPCGPS